MALSEWTGPSSPRGGLCCISRLHRVGSRRHKQRQPSAPIPRISSLEFLKHQSPHQLRRWGCERTNGVLLVNTVIGWILCPYWTPRGPDGVSMFEVMHRGKISGCRLTECAKNAIGDCILSDREPVAAVHAEGCSSAASLVAGHSQTLLRS